MTLWARVYALAAATLLLVAGGKAALLELDSAFPPDLRKAAITSPVARAAEGEILRVFATPDEKIRLGAAPDEVDPLFLELLIAVEDKRFRRHGGVDSLAVLRASWEALRQRRIVSGASTLTMQVARLLEPRPRTLRSKVIEAFRAWQLEQRFTKDEILGLYLTLAPYGGRIEGIQAASLAWFGKPPARLSPQEAALLVALPQAPERLRPDRFPEAAEAARAAALRRGFERGLLASRPPETALPSRMRPWPLLAPHLARRLAGEAEVVTMLDANLQGRVEALARRAAETLHPRAGAAVLVVERHSRAVRAYVGGADFLSSRRQGQVDMVRAHRSPGSTLKPLIYGLAFDLRVAHPETLVLDAPTGFGAYRPRNFDGVFHGELSLREALQLSLNIPAVKLMQRVGPAVFVSRLAAQNIDLAYAGDGWPGLALALGGGALSLEQLTRLYAALADDGIARPLRFGPLPDASAEPPPLLRAAARAQVGDVLLGAPRPPAALGRAGIAFKTGTSYGFRDAWAIGFDGRHVVGVWLGRPDGTPLPDASGSRTAAPLLFQIFDLLPAAPLTPLAPEPPPHGLAKLNAQTTRVAEPAPEIVFPPAGAQLRLRDLPPALALEASGGKRPLTWLVDGRPVATDSLGRRGLWSPRGAGFAQIVVIDAVGRRDAARLRLTEQRPEGLPLGRLVPR